MSAIHGIWNQTAANATSMSNSSSSSASMDSAKITANEFLTLLVTEMKNQDPTASTDPNEYVNQLVAVNSLQQLISINENLSAALGSSSSSASSYQAAQLAMPATAARNDVTPDSANVVTRALGNLSIPAASHAADRLSQALNGHL